MNNLDDLFKELYDTEISEYQSNVTVNQETGISKCQESVNSNLDTEISEYQLSDNDKKVYDALVSLSDNKTKGVLISHFTLGRYSGMSRSSVIRVLTNLIDNKYIYTCKTQHGVIYFFNEIDDAIVTANVVR